MDEMQNKAEAQPAWLQLAAGAAARTFLGLAIVYSLVLQVLFIPSSPYLGGWRSGVLSSWYIQEVTKVQWYIGLHKD